MENNSSDLTTETVAECLQQKLGPMDPIVLHAPIPFFMGFDAGGRADIYQFKNHLNGIVYVTAELSGSGQKESILGPYELMICHREESDWGPKLISALGYYTIEASVNPGDTMELPLDIVEDSNIKAIIFDKYEEVETKNGKIGLMVCIGITAEELKFKFQEYPLGGGLLIHLLKNNGVYPFTELKRNSIDFGKEYKSCSSEDTAAEKVITTGKNKGVNGLQILFGIIGIILLIKQYQAFRINTFLYLSLFAFLVSYLVKKFNIRTVYELVERIKKLRGLSEDN